MLNRLWQALFPERCVNCSRWGQYLCTQCWSQLNFLRTQFCPYCQKESPSGLTHNPLCTHHSAGQLRKYHLDGHLAAIKYDRLARRLLAEFKYFPQVRGLQKELRRILLRYFLSEEEYFAHQTIITAVPLHWIRYNERGFNQAEILAQILGEIWNTPTDFNLLKRVRYTKPQVQLNRAKRRQNIRGAFRTTNRAARARTNSATVVIVDDVWTTGATMKECARVLKQSGRAKEVWAVTLARD